MFCFFFLSLSVFASFLSTSTIVVVVVDFVFNFICSFLLTFCSCSLFGIVYSMQPRKIVFNLITYSILVSLFSQFCSYIYFFTGNFVRNRLSVHWMYKKNVFGRIEISDFHTMAIRNHSIHTHTHTLDMHIHFGHDIHHVFHILLSACMPLD